MKYLVWPFQAIFENLDNRELAVLLWIVIFFVAFSLKQQVRLALVKVIKSFFHPTILTQIALLFFYIFLVAASLHKIGFWTASLLKDTVLWGVFVAPIMLFKIYDKDNQNNVFRIISLDIFKITIVFEFLINFYVLPFLAEIVLIPFITFIVIAHAVAETKQEYRGVESFLNKVLSVLGLSLFAWVIYQVIDSADEFFTLATFRTFVLPIVLSILLIPVLYSAALWSRYQRLFTTLKIFHRNQNISLYMFGKKQIILTCKFSLKRITVLQEKCLSLNFESKEKLLASLRAVSNQFANPQTIPTENENTVTPRMDVF